MREWERDCLSGANTNHERWQSEAEDVEQRIGDVHVEVLGPEVWLVQVDIPTVVDPCMVREYGSEPEYS
jgi:hypothetical protein